MARCWPLSAVLCATICAALADTSTSPSPAASLLPAFHPPLARLPTYRAHRLALSRAPTPPQARHSVSTSPPAPTPAPSPAPAPAPAGSARSAPHSRRRILALAPPLLALAAAAVASPRQASARASAVTRGLVNLVRVREGTGVLLQRLEEGKFAGFQLAIKLLLIDTDLRNSAREASLGLAELGYGGRVSMAGSIGETVAFRLAQVVEWDGWDRLDREVDERFTKMTPEKVKFATRGLTAVQEDIKRLLALYPKEEVAAAEKLYRSVFLKGTGLATQADTDEDVKDDGGFVSF